jgi:ribonuclease HI
MEYRCVALDTGTEIFHSRTYPEGTNNIGEFLAIVHALALLAKDNTASGIYTDSSTALSWLRQKKCKTKLTQNNRNTGLFEVIARAEDWLAKNSLPVPVVKWETELWGEIPADFGRK